MIKTVRKYGIIRTKYVLCSYCFGVEVRIND